MSCQCYVASLKAEVATSGTVEAITCANFTDNAGYYSPTGYVAAGDGHSDRLFGKQITTYHFANGTYWESTDYGTEIRLTSDEGSCPDPITDTNFDPGFDYGGVIFPNGSHTSLEFEDPVLGSDLLDYAVANAAYGGWEPAFGADDIVDYSGHEAAHAAQQGEGSLDQGNTVKRLDSGAYTVSSAFVTKIKVRFSLARAGLPCRVVYDIWNHTDDVAHTSDAEFTLDAGTSSQEVEIPMVEDKDIGIANVRLYFSPWHL